MRENDIPYEEEVFNGVVWFCIPQAEDPHDWDVRIKREKPNAAQLARRLKRSFRSRGEPSPESRSGKTYADAEIELIFRVRRSPENIKALAELLERTPSAIEWIMRWCEGAQFPAKARNRIHRQVLATRDRVGPESLDEWKSIPVSVLAARAS